VEVLGLRLGASAMVPCPELADLLTSVQTDSPTPQSEREVFFPGHGRLATPVWRRDSLPEGFTLNGPAVIEEFSSTTILQPGDQARIGRLGEISIALTGETAT
jgi:N-methylhydantoinase A